MRRLRKPLASGSKPNLYRQNEVNMLETLIVLAIVAAAAGVLAHRLHATLTGRDNACGCACACDAPKTAQCAGCPAMHRQEQLHP
jgi:hypothetical protein